MTRYTGNHDFDIVRVYNYKGDAHETNKESNFLAAGAAEASLEISMHRRVDSLLGLSWQSSWTHNGRNCFNGKPISNGRGGFRCNFGNNFVFSNSQEKKRWVNYELLSLSLPKTPAKKRSE